MSLIFIQSITLLGVSSLLSLVLFFVFKTLFTRFGILDRPHLYKMEQGRKPAPYGMGILILAVLLIIAPFLFLYGDFSPLLEKRFLYVIIIGIGIALVSFVDDMDTIGKSPIKVPPLFRLAMQIGVGLVIGLTSIKISYVSHIFGGVLSLDEIYWTLSLFGNIQITVYILPIIVTIFWYVLIFNAVNFSDGIPGVTGGIASITFLILAMLAIKLYLIDSSIPAQENSRFILLILSIILPTTLILTFFDSKRSIIIGDSGTIMLGFFIATVAIIAGGKIATTVSVLGLYLIDFVYVILTRLRKGINPMKGDQSHHLHYRLLEIGLTKSQVRNIIWFLTAVFGLSAIFLSASGKIILFVMILGTMVFLTEILGKVRKSEKKEITE